MVSLPSDRDTRLQSCIVALPLLASCLARGWTSAGFAGFTYAAAECRSAIFAGVLLKETRSGEKGVVASR